MRRWLRLNPVHYSSASGEWETPRDLYHFLSQYGAWTFTLDVCATKDNAKCPRFLTKEADGLRQSWAREVCWMNPPYGREIGGWVDKAIAESSEAVTVALLPARTDTRWFVRIQDRAHKLWWIPGRLCFVGAKYPAPFPSMIVEFATREPWENGLQYGALERGPRGWRWRL